MFQDLTNHSANQANVKFYTIEANGRYYAVLAVTKDLAPNGVKKGAQIFLDYSGGGIDMSEAKVANLRVAMGIPNPRE